jgi:chitin disaccharide deacetylase
MKRLILTGDDFGLAVPVNEAIVEAHQSGTITTASLMVAGDAVADAVERAKRTPTLKVGLHLVLVEGRPVLDPASIPRLVTRQGEFLTNLPLAGVRFFFRPCARRQLKAEIRAQFEAFRATGLELDHVNTHNHMHFHPTVLSMILSIGRDFGLKAIRLPNEPPIGAIEHGRADRMSRSAMRLFLSPWLSLMSARIRRAGLNANDFVFGFDDSGAMSDVTAAQILRHLPEGTTEMYFHPATRRCPEIDRTMPGYDHVGEWKALTGVSFRAALHSSDITRISFSDLGRKE